MNGDACVSRHVRLVTVQPGIFLPARSGQEDASQSTYVLQLLSWTIIFILYLIFDILYLIMYPFHVFIIEQNAVIVNSNLPIQRSAYSF